VLLVGAAPLLDLVDLSQLGEIAQLQSLLKKLLVLQPLREPGRVA
jgi:hypothetical protein